MKSLKRLEVLQKHINASTRECSTGSTRADEPCISVAPPVGMVDEKVAIHIRGLTAGQVVTVVAEVVENGMKFESRCVYQADSKGEIDNFTTNSIGGYFKGIEPMGLFWSLKCLSAPNQSARLVKKDVSSPMKFDIKVYSDAHEEPMLSGNPIAATKVERLYKNPGVKRIQLTGKFKGTVFIPEGKGPFPSLVDMFGGLVSIIETRAALLASHGYVTMALSYMHVRSKPGFEDKLDVDLVYVKEAYEWLMEQDYVDTNRLGAVGLCYGGMLALTLAYLIPQIKAVVNINGLSVTPVKVWFNELYPSWPDNNRAYLTDEGLVVKDGFYLEEKKFPVEAWRHGAKILVIAGEDDKQIDPKTQTYFYELCPNEFKHLVEVYRYPGAGHLIEPPFSPHARATNPGRKRMATSEAVPKQYRDADIMNGGWTEPHAHAQEDSWNRTLKFLEQNVKQRR
ncbi:bile acid-CoA:amino acid N-acyltransferase-like isoform X2 [Ruditapes philippinarum]|uniref:bile acid-CoA:amino acid N-acyltransferase-like isoform X2 n=1 Tax=Ruditapes philippinarum TaxID=129788 RepID=UPI00295AC3C3|nr:bile acid-CoA:amino acid N-acyltransferase-like isoform X2 [Ruditapes philippinarum]